MLLASNIQFQWSPWLIVPALLLALLGSYLLYLRDSHWDKAIKYSLAGVRFIILFLVSILLLDPVIRQITNVIENPIWVIAVDNSTSISQLHDSAAIDQLNSSIRIHTDQLANRDMTVDIVSFADNLQKDEQIFYNQSSTNLHKLLKSISTNYENRNIAGVTLFSDGIHNQGISPIHASYPFPIHTVGIGDTIHKKDLYIQELKYNKVSYQGNQFPVLVTIASKEIVKEEKVKISIIHKGKTLASKTKVFDKNHPIHQDTFTLDAIESGLQQYTVSVSTLKAEENTTNNTRTAYIDIIDGKQRILLIAASPHPDIKALRSSLQTKENYELSTYIPTLDNIKPKGKFDLVIFHQIPQRSPILTQLFNEYTAQKTPFLIITSQFGDLRMISNALGYISIQPLGNNQDKVTATASDDFQYFSLTDHLKSTLSKLPPLETTFSRIISSQLASPLLYQRVGSVTTKSPLLLIDGSSPQKSAVLLGEGLWRWRLFEFSQHGHSNAFDELIVKTVQFLSTRQDKRKFRCAPTETETAFGKPLTFDTQIYNHLYQLTYGQRIDLAVTDDRGTTLQYSFTNNKSGQYRISGLKSGAYQYTASTTINGNTEKVNGQFAIIEQNIEQLNTTANFDLLRTIAANSNGHFFPISQLPTSDNLIPTTPPDIVHSIETLASVINLEWLLITIILLISIEWITRKYNGSY